MATDGKKQPAWSRRRDRRTRPTLLLALTPAIATIPAAVMAIGADTSAASSYSPSSSSPSTAAATPAVTPAVSGGAAAPTLSPAVSLPAYVARIPVSGAYPDCRTDQACAADPSDRAWVPTPDRKSVV